MLDVKRLRGWILSVMTGLLLSPLLAGCSGAPEPPAAPRVDASADGERLCQDSDWKEQHLGLWFDVCRHNTL